MTQQEFETRLARIKRQEDELGVVISIPYIIDKDHLDCLWYGGDVGTIEYNGFKLVIGAYGDIYCYGKIDGEDFFVKDYSNSGRFYAEIGAKVDDKKLHSLFGYKDGDHIEFENNNWFEVNLITPEGVCVDLSLYDNILDDNLLACFEDVKYYLDYVEWYKTTRVEQPIREEDFL